MKKFIDLDDMANHNCSNVLNIIQKNGTVSRRQITELSGLSWGGMTKIVNKLLENEYIVEAKKESTTSSGRIPSVLSVNTDKNFVIGLDINKTGLHAVVTDLTGKIIETFQGNVSLGNKESFIKQITEFTESIFNQFKSIPIISIGVAMQGIVDHKNGISVKFPDIADWENVQLKKILEERFNVPVFLEHDPDCLLYAHMDSQSRENIVLLRIDKSIGMAVSIGGKIIKGNGILEIAHNTVIPGGKKCRCGSSGCFEAYVYPCLENNKINTNALDELIVPLAVMIKNLAGIFNASKVILTGALMEHKELFEKKLISETSRFGKDISWEISTASDMVVTGAAGIAVKKSINSIII